FKFRGTLIENDVLPTLKKEPEPDPDPFIPSPEEVQRMRNFCMARKDQYTWKRNLVLLDLLAAIGMRAGELIRMNLEDVKKDGTIYVRSEMGEKDRYVPLPD
ncbi:MAG TPA: tyrosine-type recombinase/integrase, partial [Thermoplasmataceae archaeon]|nr:tyrosine-type recombinase/integrase [Thermoplasmataceae archaeon]